MKDLKELIQEAVDTDPGGGIDLADVLTRGRRRVRRRRAGAAVGTALGVGVLVVGTASVVGGGVGLEERVTPAGGSDPVGRVLRPADARDLGFGDDLDLLTTHVNENLDRANGLSYAGLTHDGLVVVEEGPHGPDNRVETGVLEPRSDRTTWFPEPLGGDWSSRYVGASDRWLVWSTDSDGRIGFSSVDRSTQMRTDIEFPPGRFRVAAPIGGGLRQAVLGDDGRIYFSVWETADTARLWSVPPDEPSALRSEREVGDFDVDGRHLTFTEHTNRPSAVVHVRDLRSGEETSFDARSGAGCNSLALSREDDVIAMQQYCGQDGAVRDDRIQLVSGEGEPIVTIRGDRVEKGALTDRFLSRTVHNGREAGAYLYDLDAHELLRLGRGSVKFDPTLRGAGDLVTWATPVNGRHGMKLWVGELD